MDKKTGEIFISNTKWREVLGKIVFGISTEWPRFSPTFRSLISYFARRMDVGGLKNPKQQSEKQAEWDQQVAISFLLDIDWDIPREIEEVRQKENSLKILKKELKSGVLGSVIGTASSAEKIETTGADLSIERKQLYKRLIDDYKEQEELLKEAIITFEDISSELSEREGSLTITPTERGPEFDVQVEAKRSRGITNMQIFCFDMMLIVLCQKRKTGPGFLIHDSHLFDGMDSRQVAKALEIGARTAEEHKFQYVITMNSDMVPSAEFSKNFRFNDYVLPVKVTDATVDGGLFGFRFD